MLERGEQAGQANALAGLVTREGTILVLPAHPRLRSIA
jgi:hypothetical protein